MGKTKGPYKEEFPVGSLVKVAGRDALENFMLTWKLHNRLKPEQLEHAERIGRIKSVGFYRGNDELYQIEGIPGIWHEQCLEASAKTN